MSKIVLLTLGAFLLALSVRVEAQQPKKVPRIGYLSTGSISSTLATRETFQQGLRGLGYVEARTSSSSIGSLRENSIEFRTWSQKWSSSKLTSSLCRIPQ
jgi:hypothetical protein